MRIPTTNSSRRRPVHGTTLIELSVVIMVLMAMIGATMYFGGNIEKWRKGKSASQDLREIYAAQRSFLADNPRRTLNTLTAAELVPYLPSQAASLPAPEDLSGSALNVKVTVSPPVLLASDGTVYDPSGTGEDSLWDVGE